MVLKWGADITVADNDGRTPLHEASREGHSEVVANSNGYTPLGNAGLLPLNEIFSLLITTPLLHITGM
jgi:ankyrin repeat protein